MEAVVFDEDSGQMLSGSFLDYAMPRAQDVPPFAVGMHDFPVAPIRSASKAPARPGASERRRP